MSEHSQQILTNALELPPVERAELIEQLFSSFEFSSRNTIDTVWAEEVESRIDAFEHGEIKAVSAKEVFKKIDKNKNT